MQKNPTFDQLMQLVIELKIEVEKLRVENAELKVRLAKYENPKNSRNSSIPPSKDENRPKRKSLREKTGRKQGGQKGRKGKTLKMVETPDIIEKHIPDYCNSCGNNISDINYEFVGKRQVIDIPKINFKVTEHQIFKKKCSCGTEITGDFPAQANAPVSYGNNIESLIAYFHTRQYIPFKRMQEIFKDVFNVPISQGGINYLLKKIVRKAIPAYNLIKNKLKTNTKTAVGADETGVKVNGEKHWAWTWQTEDATFISITDNRGQRSITQNFPEGFKNSVLVHDCWRSHFNTNALTHQICIAHLLRDLNYLTERYKHKWSKVCKILLKTSLGLKNKMTKNDYYIHNSQRINIENRLKILLNYPLEGKGKELISFQNRLKKYNEYILTFLYYPKVPPDNNASERAIRNIKVKQKVSGLFRSTDGAFDFAVLRSVTDTVIKNKLSVLDSLKFIANLHTE